MVLSAEPETSVCRSNVSRQVTCRVWPLDQRSVRQTECKHLMTWRGRQLVRKLIQLLAGSNVPHNDCTVVTCRGHPETPNE